MSSISMLSFMTKKKKPTKTRKDPTNSIRAPDQMTWC